MTASAPSVKLNVLASWGAHAVTVVVGFFLMPYVIKTLGDHQYGTWVFINSMASYAGLLYFGFGDTISRYVAKYQAAGDDRRLNEVVTLVLTIYLAMGAVALVVAGCLSWCTPWLSSWQDHELLEVRLTILVLGLNVATGLAGSVFGGVLMGARRFDLERGVSFWSDLARLAAILIFLREEWGILTVAVIYWMMTALENLLYMVLAYRSVPQLRIRREFLNWGTLKECSSFSTMAFLNAIAYQLTYATDSVVIGFMMGTDKIVPYYLALRLTHFLRQPIDKIAQICMPTAGALSAQSDRRKLHQFLLKACGMVSLLVTGVFIGAWFFGGDVIRTWMGSGYDESHYILTILLGAQIVALPCGVLRAFLFGLGDVRAPAILYLLEALCNLVLSIILCSFWGLVGVAWGTIIPVVVIELGLLLPIALKRLGLPFSRLWKDALLPQLLPLAALAGYSLLVSQQPWSHHGWPVLIGVTCGGGAVLGATWLLVRRGQSSGLLTAA